MTSVREDLRCWRCWPRTQQHCAILFLFPRFGRECSQFYEVFYHQVDIPSFRFAPRVFSNLPSIFCRARHIYRLEPRLRSSVEIPFVCGDHRDTFGRDAEVV
jgi:hypothetical protein